MCISYLKCYSTLQLLFYSYFQKLSTPWLKMCTSLPMFAILLTQCGHNWGFWTLLTEIPAYMGHVMNFDIKSVSKNVFCYITLLTLLTLFQNSVLSALPYFVLWILSFVFGFIADTLINRKIFSIGNVRKISNTLGKQ